MNALSCLSGNLVLVLHGFLAPARQEEAFDTVCKTIPESPTLKFKYQNAVCPEARNPLSHMVEVPIPKSAEARSLFVLSLLLYMSGNEMPLMEIFHKSPDDESNGLRPKWESYEAPPPTPHTYILIVGLGGVPSDPYFL